MMSPIIDMPCIGIIGGAGVAATNLLLNKIEKRFLQSGAFRDLHQPPMLVFQATQAPSRSMFIEGRGPSFLADYIRAAKTLEASGCSVLGMCCNTAHYFYDEIAASVNIPVVNLIKETVNHVVLKNKGKKVLLLASDGCLISKVYEVEFQKNAIWDNLVLLPESLQTLLSRAIANTKSRIRLREDSDTERPKFIYQQILNSKLLEDNIDLILLGCTDISVDFLPHHFTQKKVLDTVDVLAEVITASYLAQLPGNVNASKFYQNMGLTITDPLETKNRALDGTEIDVQLIKSNVPFGSELIDFGSGTGLIVNRLVDHCKELTAVEKFESLARFITIDSRVKLIIADLLDFKVDSVYDAVTCFATLNYFNMYEAFRILQAAFACCKPGGVFIMKHQMAISEKVLINGFSDDLGAYYFSEYRTVADEIRLAQLVGFKHVETIDIYPAEYNRFESTHFFAVVMRKP